MWAGECDCVIVCMLHNVGQPQACVAFVVKLWLPLDGYAAQASAAQSYINCIATAASF